MVRFDNIKVKGNYIYAIETDMMQNVSCRIKLHVTNDEYYHEGVMTGSMIKALWNLQSRLEKRSLRNEEVISWG